MRNRTSLAGKTAYAAAAVCTGPGRYGDAGIYRSKGYYMHIMNVQTGPNEYFTNISGYLLDADGQFGEVSTKSWAIRRLWRSCQ